MKHIFNVYCTLYSGRTKYWEPDATSMKDALAQIDDLLKNSQSTDVMLLAHLMVDELAGEGEKEGESIPRLKNATFPLLDRRKITLPVHPLWPKPLTAAEIGALPVGAICRMSWKYNGDMFLVVSPVRTNEHGFLYLSSFQTLDEDGHERDIDGRMWGATLEGMANQEPYRIA
jgi:hypothetical protein